MTVYQVKARRSGDWWALEVPEVPGVLSQAKRLDKADAAAREAIAVMLDVAPDAIEVTVEPELRADEQAAMQEVLRTRKAVQAAAEAEREATRQAAAVLTRHLSQRDVGRVMGVSYQRVSQILAAYRKAT